MIQTLGVWKVFNKGKTNEVAALKDVNVLIKAREVTIIKGASGSGKTTLLTVMGCVARPTSGRIWVNGKEVTSLPDPFLSEVRRAVFGFVFQSINLIAGMTVLENVVAAAYPLGVPWRQLKERALTLLKWLGIEDKAGEKANYLSGGEAQRTAIARALINDPDILIADEPTAHLDTGLSEDFMNIVGELKRKGKTVVIATHDPLVYGSPEVDRVVEIRDGVILP